jgi:thioredoxin reductase (NADPH)
LIGGIVYLASPPRTPVVLVENGAKEADTPVVVCGRIVLLRKPSNGQLADVIGIRRPLEKTVYD